MKLIYQKLTAGSDEGFTFKRIRTRNFSCPWHFHPEFELILTLDCAGFRMVGDNITPLKPGDLVLLGANLPHIWQRDLPAGRPARAVDILLVQFEEDFLGKDCLRVPAMLPVRRLLRRAAVGLRFTGRTRDQAAALMREMDTVRGMRRVVLFLRILEALAFSSESRAIASSGFAAQQNPFNEERMNRVFQFIDERLDEPLQIGDAARVANLSAGAFSRFFHQHTARTFPAFVNELRIGRACRWLAETNQSVTEIALACGFANLSNFNRQFQRLKGTTPSCFRNRLLEAD
ncbi:MAG: helix-turn-helix transcriptional regulator [Verrucomicrobia bacterium]|nr:helix-turn-helix transcriptional regulator [Verrucomicrobiota bacterium]